METISNESPGMDHDDFEDGNDSDLEGRLYAEIYYSNEVHETGENYQDNCKQTIQQIKDASQSCIRKSPESNVDKPSENSENIVNYSEKNCFLTNNRINFESENRECFLSKLDNNLNLEKQQNSEADSENISSKNNEVPNENLDLQEEPDRNVSLQSNTPKPQKNKHEMTNRGEENGSPSLKNGQKENTTKKKNSLESPQVVNDSSTTPKAVKKSKESLQLSNDSATPSKSMKRSSGTEKDFGNKRRKRNPDLGRSADVNPIENQLHPIRLTGRKSFADDHQISFISDKTMDLLFPDGWERNKRQQTARQKRKEKRRLKKTEDNLNVNDNSIQRSSQQIEKDEIIEISSSDSSQDDIDEVIPSTETLQVEEKNQKEENATPSPKQLDDYSDSDESILEVPVPPKPSPPVVDLKETDGDSSDSDDGIYDLTSNNTKKKLEKNLTVSNSNSTSDDSEDGSEEDSRCSAKDPRENLTATSVRISKKDSKEPEDDVSNEASDSSYSDFPADGRNDDLDGDNLILNCTDVQKGASSLEEIKSMRKVVDSGRIGEEANRSIHGTSTVEITEPGPSTSSGSRSSTVNRTESDRRQETKKTYKTSREKSDGEYFFEPMLDVVKAFYNNSWGGENFSVEETQQKMSKDPKNWAILDEDWKPSLVKRQRYFLSKMKCNLCRQSGHLRANCPEPKKSPVCHMCGSQGHYETRCPHKICLTCGKKQNTFRKTCESCERLNCTLCRSRGHDKNSCPDLWRQYHHTTSETDHQLPKKSSEVMKPSNLLICCNCTKRGHDSSSCTKYRWSQHFSTPSYVKDYEVCDQMIPKSSRNPVEIIDVDDSLQESSQSGNEDIQPRKTTEKKSSQVPANFNLEPDVKFLFKRKQRFHPKSIRKLPPGEFDKKHRDCIVLSDIKGAELKGLIEGQVLLKFLTHLGFVLQFDVCITHTGNSKIEMNLEYYSLFSQRYVMKKIICHWLRLSDEDKDNIEYKKLRMRKRSILSLLNTKFDELDNVQGNVKELYDSVTKSKRFENKTPESKSDLIFFRKREKKLIEDKSKLVMLLYRHDCASEKGALSKFRKMFITLRGRENVTPDAFIWIFYYYNLIFAKYTPPDLKRMVDRYFALTGNRKSLNGPVSNDDQEQDEQMNVSQERVDNNFYTKEPAPLNRFLNGDHSPSFPPEFYKDRSTSSGSRDTPTPNRRSITFSSPAADFIPISDAEPRQPSTSNEREDRNQFGQNPMHCYKEIFPKASKTNERLMEQATSLMSKALKMNIPHVTKAAIRVGDLINENKLSRKHVYHLKYIINQQRRDVR